MDWAKTMQRAYEAQAACCFILHGNVSDYQVGNAPVSPKLRAAFAHSDCFVEYSRGSGFTFGSNVQKRLFIMACGLGAMQEAMGKPVEEAMLPSDVYGAMRCISAALSSRITAGEDTGEEEPARFFVCIKYAHSVIPDPATSPEDRHAAVVALEWGHSEEIAALGHVIVLVTQDLLGVNHELRSASSRWMALEIPLPDYQQRLEHIAWGWRFLQSRAQELQVDPAPIREASVGTEQAAALTAGLSRYHILALMTEACIMTEAMSREHLTAAKRRIMSQEHADVISPWDPPHGFESVGGHVLIKDYLRRRVVRQFAENRKDRIPNGIMLLGPSGTGKTTLAAALAKECGINSVKLDPAKLFGKYVGDTERAFARAMSAIKALAPCLVFIDEIDQKNGQRGSDGDSGVSGRAFSALLEAMADPAGRGSILWVAATNRPDLVDAAMLAPHRMEIKIPVLPPNSDERREVVEVRIGHPISASDWAAFSEPTDGWTGAELATWVNIARDIHLDDDVPLIEALGMGLERFTPNTEKVHEWTALALAQCQDRSLVPEQYRTARTQSKSAPTVVRRRSA